MAYRGLVSLLILCLIPNIYADEFVVTQTEFGYVQGSVLRNVDNGEYKSHVVTYYAVPFATAQRFAKPVRNVAPWSGMRQTKWTDGKACPQGGGIFDITHPGWRDFSEDCLHVNIFRPFESATAGPYPVMVWFYGGAFTSGGNIMYPGHFLATRDVVVVVANYRVGHFGFAFTGNDACPGNFGLWDQIAALEFVRDNIANFGGDPNRVTIYGQSAGAASVGHHTVSPVSQSLFHQAIFESGTESNFWSLNYPESSPENYIWQISEKLSCGTKELVTAEEMIDCLRLLPWEDVDGERISCTPGHFCQGMAPVVDGPGGILPQKPDELRASGNVHKGPMLTGLTHDDGSLYTSILIPESFLGGYNRTRFHKYLRERLLAIWAPQMEEVGDQDTIDKAFWSIDYNYAPWPYVNNEYENREAFNEMITDAAFGYPWDRQMKDQNQYNNIYGYIYNYRGRNGTDFFPEWMGVPHQGELPQVWGWTLLPRNPHVREDSGIFYDMVNWTDEDRTQTVFWQTMWTNFAKTGNPSPNPVENPTDGDPITWRPFKDDDTAFVYVNNVTTEMRTLWRQKSYAFWRDYFVAYLTKDYSIPLGAPVASKRTDSASGQQPDNNVLSKRLRMMRRKNGSKASQRNTQHKSHTNQVPASWEELKTKMEELRMHKFGH